MRHLASIQRIKSLEPIEGADAILKATVLGWELVVKKGEFKVGDLCVYLEIDSVLPEKPEFEFLRNKNFRIKTIRLRGQISQGICFPLDILPKCTVIEEDRDVTDILGIIKYESPIPANLAGVVKGSFPSFIPKTDETRVQVMQKELTSVDGALCFITEKIDGTSVTYFIKDGQFGVCSRNMELEENEDNLYWQMAKQLNIEEKLRSLNKNLAIQGELAGEGIQGNKLKLKGRHVFFFNLFLIDNYRYAAFSEWYDVTKNILQLETVPVLDTDYILTDDIAALLKKAERNSELNAAAVAEGIVIRVKESERLISFKAINTQFLLKYE